MPLIYGSNFPLAPLAKGSVGVYVTPPKKSNSFLSMFLNILLSAIEVGISFIPGVGFALTVPLGVAFAAARAGVTSAINGTDFDLKSFGIDAATPFLSELGGGLIKGIRGITQAREIIDTTTRVGETLGREGAIAAEQGSRFLAEAEERVMTGVESGLNTNLLGTSEALHSGANVFKETSSSLKSLAENTPKLSIFNSNKVLTELKTQIASFQENIYKLVDKELLSSAFGKEIGQYFGTTFEGISGTIGGVIARQFSEGFLTKAIEQGALKGTEALIDNVRKEFGTTSTIAKGALKIIEEAEEIGVSNIKLINALIKYFASHGVEASEEKIVALILQKFSLDGAFKAIKNTFGIKQAIIASAKRFEKKELLEYSHDLIKNVFQPGDFIGDQVRKQFTRLSKRIEEFIKPWVNNIKKSIGLGKKFIQEFERTGGIVVNSNVVAGYKVIKSEGLWDLIQISFHPDTTGAKSGRNKNGKKPVYKWASKTDQAKLISGGMAFYLTRWANSRGGRGKSNEVEDFFNALPIVSQFASALLPVRELTQIVSIISLVERGVKNYEKHGGSKIWEEFVNDIKGKAISGSTGVLGRTIGTTLGGGFIGKLVGKSIANYIRPILREGKPENVADYFAKEVKQVARHSINHLGKHSTTYKGIRRVKTTMRLSKRIRGIL